MKAADHSAQIGKTGIAKRLVVSCLCLAIILAIAVALDVSYGEAGIPVLDVARVIASHMPFVRHDGVSDFADLVVWRDRVPRAVLALLVGAMLSMAGAALQGLLRNPLADPYTVGVSSGAALGAGVAVLLKLRDHAGGFGVPILAFVFAMAAMGVVYLLARSAGRVSMHSFLLAGIVVGSLLWALLSFVLALAASDQAGAQSKIIFWLLGSFDSSSSTSSDPWAFVRIAAPFALIGVLVLSVFARDLNLFTLGEESARHLGVETERLKLLIISVTSLITAAAVSVSGIIGFIGLVVPHICRRIVGPDHRVLIPASALAGSVLAVLADLAARAVLPPSGMPVGIVTALLGAPFFLYLLRVSSR